MEQQIQSRKMIRKRKFLLVLPLLALPFLTLLFWSMGGGTRKEKRAEDSSTGLNLALPDVALKEEQPLSKLDYYNRAQSDSIKYQALIKNDPHYKAMAFVGIEEGKYLEEDGDYSSENQRIVSFISGSRGDQDPNEERVYRKLAQLDEELSKLQDPHPDAQQDAFLVQKPIPAVHSADIDRLERMMQTMNQPEGEDEEIRQLNGMLEKILDIQHPDRVQEKLKQISVDRKGEVFAVVNADLPIPISSLGSELGEQKRSPGFHSLEDPFQAMEAQNSLQAVIHETQTLVNGATVKLRLLDEVYISGRLIPKNQFLFGTASLNRERLMIKISSIRYQHSLFPVDLSVYDIDGLDGIYIPGAVGRDVANESAGRAMQNLGFSYDPSVGAQATSAGIEAAKSLVNRKVKQVKVIVKAGYRVLLKDEKQK